MILWILFDGPSKRTLIQPKPKSHRTHTFLYRNFFTAPVKAHSRRRFFSHHLPRSAGAPSPAPLPYSRSAHRRRRSGSGSQRRRQRLTLAPSPPVLRTPAGDPACVPLSLIPPPVDCQRHRPRHMRRARPDGCGSQQPLLHQGVRAALVALMPQSEALPVLLALQRAEACA
jgi:hypothetical protein